MVRTQCARFSRWIKEGLPWMIPDEYPDCTIWRQRLQRRLGIRFDGMFTEAAGLAYSTDSMTVWFSVDGTRPVALHHPFFGSAEKVDPAGNTAASTR